MPKIPELGEGVLRRVIPAEVFGSARDLVLEITREGVVLRGHRTQKKVFVSWAGAAWLVRVHVHERKVGQSPLDWLLE